MTGMFDEPSEEQRLIRASVADLVAREAAPDRLARLRETADGFDADFHHQAAELGWLGLVIPEEYGGSPLPVAEAAAIFEELGRAPVMGPVLTSGILASLVVLDGGPESIRGDVLPAMAAGDRILAVAAMETGRGWGPELVGGVAVRDPGGDLRLTTGPRFVQGGGPADAFVVAVRERAAATSAGAHSNPRSAISLFLVDRDQPGVNVERPPGLPFGLVRLTLDGVRRSEAARIGAPGEGWTVLERAAHGTIPYLCAFAVGGCLEILDFTVEYTRQRWAFGQPIGRFQRVQDHVVELLNHADAARLVTAALLARLESGEDARAGLHEAAAVALDAWYQAVNYSHMVHAGPGTDLDHPLMGHTLASRAIYQWLGTPDRHKRLMMDRLYPPSGGEARIEQEREAPAPG